MESPVMQRELVKTWKINELFIALGDWKALEMLMDSSMSGLEYIAEATENNSHSSELWRDAHNFKNEYDIKWYSPLGYMITCTQWERIYIVKEESYNMKNVWFLKDNLISIAHIFMVCRAHSQREAMLCGWNDEKCSAFFQHAFQSEASLEM